MVSTLLHLIWGYISSRLLGISLLPVLALSVILDLDFLIGFLKGRPHEHRYYFHNIFGVFIIALITSLFLPVIETLAIIVHLLFDMIDGEGVPLFYPLSKNKYLLLKVGKDGILFPKKVFWEGNKYFSAITLTVFIVSVLL